MLDADRGEALWKEKRGPKNASLEGCDLGKGPGKVEGAFAELPRYFADADRVMDLETRIVWCMETLQGFDRAEILKRPYSKANQPGTELEALATYVASKSRGMKYRAAPRARQGEGDAGAGRGAVLPPPGPDGFLLRHLPWRRRPAHPPAEPAVPRASPRRRARWSASGRPIASRRAR